MAEQRKISPVIILAAGAGIAAAAAAGIYALARAAPPEEEIPPEEEAPPEVYTCPVCGAEFSTLEKLQYHFTMTHPHEEIPIEWQYCHSLPTDINALFTGAGVRVSQPFIPCTSFKLKEILFTLRRKEGSDYPPLSTGFISIHNATERRKPIEPHLRKSSFNIAVPSYPGWGIHKATFDPILLEADTLYTWVIGFGYQLPENARIYAEMGEEGLCNLDPITPTYISYWQEGHWQDWKLFALLQLSYEMKGD